MWQQPTLAALLWEQRFWPLLADGSLTVTFRRWRRPQAVAGRRYRTPAGIIEAERVDVVAPEKTTDCDARRARSPSAAPGRAALRGDEASPVYRIEFPLVAEPDPRAVLAADDDLSAEECAA